MLIYDAKKAHNSIISRVYAPTQDKDKNSFAEPLLELNNVIGICDA